MRSHIRSDKSTYHVVNFQSKTNIVKQRFTNQGFADESCLARGQAWGIVGFIRAYGWTKDWRFLDTSRALADYFVDHFPEDQVPYWDFNAPKPGPRDTSAALIAAYEMLLLYKHDRISSLRYFHSALQILYGVISMSLSPKATLSVEDDGREAVSFRGPETVVLNATINNNECAPCRWPDHGLVYADYYFLLIGNALLDLGLA